MSRIQLQHQQWKNLSPNSTDRNEKSAQSIALVCIPIYVVYASTSLIQNWNKKPWQYTTLDLSQKALSTPPTPPQTNG